MATTSSPFSTENQSAVVISISVLTALVGTITNTLSLSYFVVKYRSNALTRNIEIITTKLFVVLNVFDLLLSVSALLYFMSVEMYDVLPTFLAVCYTFFSVFLLATSFLTCLVAVVRAIFVFFPLHKINWWLIKASMLAYLVVVTALCTIRVLTQNPMKYAILTIVIYHVRFYIVAILFLVVLASNALAVIKLFLLKSRAKTCRTDRRKATITVGIISLIYCVCNIGFVIMAGVPVFSVSAYQKIPMNIIDTFIYILLPLNSACNPMVYFARRADMISYLKSLKGRLLLLCFCGQYAINSRAKR
jgi:hypothetical protein